MLPRKITVGSDDWSRLTNEDIETIPYLQDFFGALEFCNAVIQVLFHLNFLFLLLIISAIVGRP